MTRCRAAAGPARSNWVNWGSPGQAGGEGPGSGGSPRAISGPASPQGQPPALGSSPRGSRSHACQWQPKPPRGDLQRAWLSRGGIPAGAFLPVRLTGCENSKLVCH